jgi:hypothetical protein
VTYETTAPEANRSSQKLMLYELAPKVARIHCERRDEAVGVEDGRLPPSEWGHELDDRRLEFIKRNLDIALGQFDSSDLFIAALFLGVSSTSGEFEVWKLRNSDWQTRIARVRTERRREYEAEKRKILEDRAFSTVAGHMAGERKQQATEEIQLALRAALMDPKATVRATSNAGERRQLDRAEIVEAGIDHVRNRLEIRGSWWCDVEVECPPTIEAQSAPAALIVTAAPYSHRKQGVAEKDDLDLLAKVRRARVDNPKLTLYAAVRQHCGEKTENGVEAAYKRVKRKINRGNSP